MVSNNNQQVSGGTGDTVDFERAVSRLYINASGSSLTVSFDGGTSFFTLDSGVNELNLSPISSVEFGGSGTFSLIGVSL